MSACSNCGTPAADGDIFCGSCGTPLETPPQPPPCPHCGRETYEGDIFCGHCGGSLTHGESAEPAPEHGAAEELALGDDATVEVPPEVLVPPEPDPVEDTAAEDNAPAVEAIAPAVSEAAGEDGPEDDAAVVEVLEPAVSEVGGEPAAEDDLAAVEVIEPAVSEVGPEPAVEDHAAVVEAPPQPEPAMAAPGAAGASEPAEDLAAAPFTDDVATTACPACGAAVLPGDTACDECGTAFGAADGHLHDEPDEVPAADGPVCAQCGTPALSDAAFCGECGASLAAPAVATAPACPTCGAPIDPHDAFCGECGTHLQVAPPIPAAAAQPACATCRAPLQPGDRFCGDCGTPAPAAAVPSAATVPLAADACPSCGAAVSPGDAFCGECGTGLHAAAPQAAAVAAAPRPAAAAARPAAPAASQPAAPELVLSVPEWLAKDWGIAVAFAITAALWSLAYHYAVGLLSFLGLFIADFPLEWGELLRLPAVVWFASHGGVEGVGLWITGIAIIALSFWMSSYVLGARLQTIGRDGPMLAVAAKTGFVYGGVLLVAGLLLPRLIDLIRLDFAAIVTEEFSGGVFDAAEVAAAFFLAILIGAISGLVVLARRTGTPLPVSLGLRDYTVQVPVTLRAAWSGAKRTLLIGGVGLVIFVVVGEFLEIAGEGPSATELIGVLILLFTSAVLWAGLDVAFLYLVFSMRFFAGDEAVIAGGRPGWVLVGTVITLIAFVIGGRRAAEVAQAPDQVAALRAGALVGPILAVVLVGGALFHTDVEDIVAPALLLPLLWSLASAAGGLVYAGERGLLTGVRLQVGTSGPDRQGDDQGPPGAP